ncbi:uncharacterized protein LOC121367448 [Gigantopelta aegis]|uniref:uncharacterized protein LOC121367448 n=1 Tax=Gigantopelta aegis TaxID=1735272 RepID=UPI001B8882FC|nr:uncharacterized protein LOC121367448 [Gigantopelta aegis]
MNIYHRMETRVTLGLGIAGGAVVLLIIIFIYIFWFAIKDCAARKVECHCIGCWCEVRRIYHDSGCSRSVQAVNYRHSGYSLDEPTAWRQPGTMSQEPSNDIHPSAPPISRSDAGPSVPPIPNVSKNPGAPPPSYHKALDMPRTAAETTLEENPPGYRQAVQVYGVLV